eukprot:14506190-Alexandrium_andersonii.AAC.1
MSASLVGSEMCIRDRYQAVCRATAAGGWSVALLTFVTDSEWVRLGRPCPCLLYTSDAADDM